jgi:hypothetical protein
MKPLPDEVEILKVFDAIQSVSGLKVPDISQIVMEPLYRGKRGYCSDVGQVGFNLVECKDRTCANERFVETVVHEIVHYNYWELAHSQKFYDILYQLLPKVLKQFGKEKGDDINTGKEEAKSTVV